MKTHNHVHSWGDLSMEDRQQVSSTLADWHSELCIKRAFGRVWFSHCGAAYDLSAFRGVPRSTVEAIYYEPRSEQGRHKALLIVFAGVSYQVPVWCPPRITEFRTERELLARNYKLL